MDNTATATRPAQGNKWPIRFEAIIPLAIVIGLASLYFTLFFDTHLRHVLEYGATQANGAEVNIGKLETGLWNASVIADDIAVTNPDKPSRNLLQIGSINFSLLWDALLRGKVLIEEASINDVQIDTPRKRAGRVLPARISEDSGSSGNKLMEQMKEEFSGNVLGDLAAIAAGAGPGEQLAAMGADIRSGAYLTGMHKSLDEKSKQWKSRMATMPEGEDFSAMQSRLADVKLDNLEDVTQIRKSMKELESIRKDLEAKSRAVSETGAALKGDMGEFRNSFSDLDKIVKEDVNSLKERMRLPSLDARILARALFGMDMLGKMQQTRGYMDRARNFMPAKGEKKKAVMAHERKKGRDYVFSQTTGYPRFWLRKALISSRLPGGESDLSGEINNLTTDPDLAGRSLVATIKGDFPQQGITGIKATLVIDHTTPVPAERMVMEVGRYAIVGRSLVNSPAVEIGISKAEGSVRFSAELREDSVDVRMASQFTKVALETNAKSDVVREMINASVMGLKSINLDAHVTGTWSRLDWQLSTNLADALERGMRRYLQGKADDSRARIEKLVNGMTGDQRKRLYARQREIESELKSRLAGKQAQIGKLRTGLDAAKSKLEARKNALADTQQQKIEESAGEALDNLRKEF